MAKSMLASRTFRAVGPPGQGQPLGGEELRARVAVAERPAERLGVAGPLPEPPAQRLDHGAAGRLVGVAHQRRQGRGDARRAAPPRPGQEPGQELRVPRRREAVDQSSEQVVAPRVLVAEPAVVGLLVIGVDDRLVIAADHHERGERRLAGLRLAVEEGQEAGRRTRGRGTGRRPGSGRQARPCRSGRPSPGRSGPRPPGRRRGPPGAAIARRWGFASVAAASRPASASKAAGSFLVASSKAAASRTAAYRDESARRSGSRAEGSPVVLGGQPADGLAPELLVGRAQGAGGHRDRAEAGDQELGRLARQVVGPSQHRLLQDRPALLGRHPLGQERQPPNAEVDEPRLQRLGR